MKITFEENLFKVYDGENLVKQNKCVVSALHHFN